MTHAFNGVCKELLSAIKRKKVTPIYDVTLIVEA